jgi:hypothetical protein
LLYPQVHEAVQEKTLSPALWHDAFFQFVSIKIPLKSWMQ